MKTPDRRRPEYLAAAIREAAARFDRDRIMFGPPYFASGPTVRPGPTPLSPPIIDEAAVAAMKKRIGESIAQLVRPPWAGPPQVFSDEIFKPPRTMWDLIKSIPPGAGADLPAAKRASDDEKLATLNRVRDEALTDDEKFKAANRWMGEQLDGVTVTEDEDGISYKMDVPSWLDGRKLGPEITVGGGFALPLRMSKNLIRLPKEIRMPKKLTKKATRRLLGRLVGRVSAHTVEIEDMKRKLRELETGLLAQQTFAAGDRSGAKRVMDQFRNIVTVHAQRLDALEAALPLRVSEPVEPPAVPLNAHWNRSSHYEPSSPDPLATCVHCKVPMGEHAAQALWCPVIAEPADGSADYTAQHEHIDAGMTTWPKCGATLHGLTELLGCTQYKDHAGPHSWAPASIAPASS